MFRKSIQRCMLRRARCQLAAATAPTTQRSMIHECSIKAGGLSDGMNGRMFESQMLSASNSVHQTYNVISLGSLKKSEVNFDALKPSRRKALLDLSEAMKILKNAEKAKQEHKHGKDRKPEAEKGRKPGKGQKHGKDRKPEAEKGGKPGKGQKRGKHGKSGKGEKPTVETVLKDVQCDFVAVMKPAADEQRAMQGMNDFCRRTADKVAVLTLKPGVPHEEKQEQETPTLSKVVEDNFFVTDETSVPTKVLMEITVASTFFELQRKLYQLAKADAYLDCVQGERDLHRRLLMVAINSNKDTAEESIKKLFEPDQADFRELVRRALQPDATKDNPVQVVVLWAPFRNIYDEMHGMNQKLDNMREDTNKKLDQTNSRIDDTNKKLDDMSKKFDELITLISGGKKEEEKKKNE